MKKSEDVTQYKNMTKTDWLLLFRRAKTIDNLDIMYDARVRRLEQANVDLSVLAELVRSYDLRASEIEAGKFCNKNRFI